MTPLPIQLPKGRWRKLLMKPLPMLLHATFLQNPESLFSSSFLSLYTENYTWVGWHRRPFLLHLFQSFLACSMKRRFKKTLLIFTAFFMCPYTWPVYCWDRGSVDRCTQSHFHLYLLKWGKNKKKLFEIGGLFSSPPPFYVQTFFYILMTTFCYYEKG